MTMIQLANVNFEFREPEDWEYSAEPLVLKSFELEISSDRFRFRHEVSFEGDDTPLEFFRGLHERRKKKTHWQSLCQEIFLTSEYANESYTVLVKTYNDSDDFDSSCGLDITLHLEPEEIRIDMSKLTRLFGGIKGV